MMSYPCKVFSEVKIYYKCSLQFTFSLMMDYVEQAVQRFKLNPTEDSHEQGVLEKLLKVDQDVARVMATDMLLAGVDTV